MRSVKGVFFNLCWPPLSLFVSVMRRLLIKNKLPRLFNKEVLIVGTSPELDFDLLFSHRKMFSIGLHRVHKIYSKTAWRPDVLILGDERLIHNYGNEIIACQSPKTVLATGSRFFIPFGNSQKAVTYINIINKGDSVIDHSDNLPPEGVYFAGRSVVLLALQYCIKERVKKIILTGVNFNYEKGYIDESINNDGLNQPVPIIAKEQFLSLIKICNDLNIEVQHSV